MNILICEDEEILLTALDFRLRKNGFTIVRAKDGREAIACLKKGDIDMIVSDIMMPKVSGLKLVDYVRKEMKSAIPIIIISALEHEDIVLESFEKGANDFVAKPFKPNELILRIKRIIQELEVRG